MDGGEHQMDGGSPGPHDESGMSPGGVPDHHQMDEAQHQEMMNDEEYKQA